MNDKLLLSNNDKYVVFLLNNRTADSFFHFGRHSEHLIFEMQNLRSET